MRRRITGGRHGARTSAQADVKFDLVAGETKAVLSTSHPVTVTAREFFHFLQGIPTPKVSLPRVDFYPVDPRYEFKTRDGQDGQGRPPTK